MIDTAGRLALIGALTLAATATRAQEGGTTSAPAPQSPPPVQAPATPAPAPAPATPSASPESAAGSTAAPTDSNQARNRPQRYTWHGAWRDRARRSVAARTGRGNAAGPARRTIAATPAAAPIATSGGTGATPAPIVAGAQPDVAVPPAPVATARPRPRPTPAPAMPSVATGPLWPWVAGGALLLLLAAAWALTRLRRQEDDGFEQAVDVDEPFVSPETDQAPEPLIDTHPAVEPTFAAEVERPDASSSPPSPASFAAALAATNPPLAPAPVEPAEVPPAPRRAFPAAVPATAARLSFEFRPVRAGVNLVTATAEAEITVTNSGDAPAHDLRAEMRLVSAHAGQDEEIAAIVAAPVTRPAAPPFTLEPGESRQLRLTAVLPREAIRVLTASDRPMFVPLAVVKLVASDGTQASQAFAIGIERPGSGKLAPFWLDGPSRMYNSVAALPQGTPVER